MTRRDADSSAEPVPGSENHIRGRRFLSQLDDWLADLHKLYAHGNRKLFPDQVVVAHLLAFFNPTFKGLRSFEDFFKHPRMRQRYGTPMMPRSTLSDAQKLFDPALLLPLIESLKQRVTFTSGKPKLEEITEKLLAVDGTFFTVAHRIAWAVFNHSGKGNVRMHTQFNVLTGLPENVSLTDGQTREEDQLQVSLMPHCLYVIDRGYQRFSLYQAIHDAQSHFVVRLRKETCRRVVADRPLSDADRQAGVLADQDVQLGSPTYGHSTTPVWRCVQVGTTDRHGQPVTLILLTNRTDLSAEMIAMIYKHRWQVELFFRWLKCTVQFRHFFSESPQGMTWQVYVAIIGTLLMAVCVGAQPSRYDYTIISLVFNGTLPWDGHTQKIIAERQAERQRAAQRQRARAAEKARR